MPAPTPTPSSTRRLRWPASISWSRWTLRSPISPALSRFQSGSRLKSDAEWRWLTGRCDSPWYTTMRLFRQPRRGIWRDVFEAMARKLAPLCERRAAPRMLAAPCSLGRADPQDHHPAHQGRTHRGAGKTRQRPARTGAARAAGAGGRRVRADRSVDRPARRRECAPVGDRRCNSRLRTRRGLRSPLRSARTLVYSENDTRAAIKRAINTLAGSALVEENNSYALVSSARTGVVALCQRVTPAVPALRPAARRRRAGFRFVDPRRQIRLASRFFSTVSSICTASWTRQRDVAHEREAQAVARAVADAALAQEAVGAVEHLGRAQARALPRASALLVALDSGPGPVRRNDPISDLSPSGELQADISRRFRPGAPILPLDPLENCLRGAVVRW